MIIPILGFGAAALYLIGWLFQLIKLRDPQSSQTIMLAVMAAAAILLHGLTTWGLLFVDAGLDLGLFKVLTLLALVINCLVWVSALSKPVQNLYLALFPISVVVLTVTLTGTNSSSPILLSSGLQTHILLSVLAYSFLAIAATQALLCGYQNWQLKHKHQNALMRALPALETMESLLFQAIWLGQVLLTLSLLSGFLVYENLLAQQLVHKVVFSLLAWLVYAVLLVGRHYHGWRGKRAINWTWMGFIAILLGYIGSKFVIEFILR
jgi:ABC-type uncharacterized transport system permease subunit